MTIHMDSILIVEDDDDSRQVIEEALSYYQADLTIRSVTDGTECLSELDSYRPSLVIMDLRLPELDGWAALDAIRRNPTTAHLPVIAVTAYHSPKVADEALRAGFNGYVSKPIDVFSFGARVAQIMQV